MSSCMCPRVHFLFVRFFVPVQSKKKKNARLLSAILLICKLLKIKECGIRSVVGHLIVFGTGEGENIIDFNF